MTVLCVGPSRSTVVLDTFEVVDFEFDKAKDLLRGIFPPGGCKDDAIAVAGSAPLFWMQKFAGVGPTWEDGPSDVDIFVCGFYSAFFDVLVNHVLTQLNNRNFIVTDMERYQNYYATSRGPIEVCDLTLAALQWKLSLIRCPSDRNIDSVIQSFDINVCRVVYSIERDELRVAADVYNSVESGEATVANISFGNLGPGNSASVRVGRTIRRMAKYSARGFRFLNGGGVMFVS